MRGSSCSRVQAGRCRLSSLTVETLAFALLYSLLQPVGVVGQTATFRESWRWAAFTTESGLPTSRVHDVVETSDGVPWAVTDSGLAWYDGFTWQTFEDSVLGTERLRSVKIDAAGRLLIVAKGRLFHGDTAGFDITPSQYVSEDLVILDAVAFPSGGELLAATRNPSAVPDLYLLDGGTLEPFESPGPLASGSPRYLWLTRSGRAWVLTVRGLHYWDGSTCASGLRTR